MLAKLVPIWIAYFFAAATPGPSQVFLVESTTFGSRAQGRLGALGVTLGTGIWVLFVALGLNQFIERFEDGRNWLRAGSLLLIAYFLYRNVAAFLTKSRVGFQVAGPMRVESGGRIFTKGFLVNIINPNSAVFFLSLFAPLLAETHDPTQLVVCVTGVMVLSLAWYQALVSLAAVPGIQQRLRDSERWLRLCLSGIYLYFLVRLLRDMF